MILPPDFINTISNDALDDFLEHLIISNAGPDGYQGDLQSDRKRLLVALRSGQLLIEHRQDEDDHNDEEGSASFSLITRENAMTLGYRGV
jgi:hypothetical protein